MWDIRLWRHSKMVKWSNTKAVEIWIRLSSLSKGKWCQKLSGPAFLQNHLPLENSWRLWRKISTQFTGCTKMRCYWWFVCLSSLVFGWSVTFFAHFWVAAKLPKAKLNKATHITLPRYMIYLNLRKQSDSIILPISLPWVRTVFLMLRNQRFHAPPYFLL